MVHGEAIREVEVTVGVSEPTPLGHKVSLAIKLLNPLIAGIADIHVPRIIDRNTPGRTELTGFLGLGTARMTCPNPDPPIS